MRADAVQRLVEDEGSVEAAEAVLRRNERRAIRDQNFDQIDKAKEELRILADGSYKGHLYEIELDDSIVDRMLDWDAPVEHYDDLPRQIVDDFPDEAEDIAQITGAPGSGYEGQPETGRSIYEWLSGKLGGDDKASQYLSERGIPGIRYFDNQSRGAAEGTRNIVVFDPDDITQVKRDGELVFQK